jgi:hypothetical protein
LSYSAYSDDQKEQAILRAMDYLEALPWKGAKEDEDNALEWPRSGVVDHNGYSIDSDEIPAGIINGVCRAAYEEMVDIGCLNEKLERDDVVKRETIGPITTEYFAIGSPKSPEYKILHAHIQGYLKTASGSGLLRC